jgi:hypothetical protein
MPPLRALLLLGAVAQGMGGATPSLPWAWSWSTLPTLAFPGPAMPSGARFMTAAEETAYVSNYTMLMIWGANATCLAADGTTFSPSCIEDESKCYCNRSDPFNQRWVTEMEANVLAQGAALKARAAALGKGNYPVLGYIEGLSLQQWYDRQAALLYNASKVPFLLSVESKGLINCFAPGIGCNWQGVEMRQLDLRKPEVVDYFINEIVFAALDGPGLDGVFIDAIEWWIDACGKWPCTAAERASLVNASLVATDALLAAAAGWGKIISVSSHTSLGSNGDYYNKYANILARYPGVAIRFYEFWVQSNDMVTTLVRETQELGLAVHVHTNKRTMNPDWVELAAFLIGAGEYSYFSASANWMLDSWTMYPEFTRPLGPPTSPPVFTPGAPETYTPWQLIPAQNLVYGAPPCGNCSLPGVAAYVGIQPSADACLAAVRTTLPSATGMTWVSSAGGDYALGCWARVDAAFLSNAPECVLRQTAAAPCYSQPQGTGTSAAAVAVARNGTAGDVWTRSYEHLKVTYKPGLSAATLVWA